MNDYLNMDGLLRCSRYAFGPNRLHYCGPDANQEILAYLDAGAADPGLAKLLGAFRTMFPYLQLIAQANGLRDPFDERVVEAYWLGNELLENVGRQRLRRHLTEKLDVKRQMDPRAFRQLEDQIAHDALPHHNFHVLDVWKRAGTGPAPQTIESLDACRVSSGEVLEVDGPSLIVETQPLVEINGRLALGAPIRKKVRRALESLSDIEQVTPGQIVSLHWDVPCEVITPEQAARLKKYTLQHLGVTERRSDGVRQWNVTLMTFLYRAD